MVSMRTIINTKILTEYALLMRLDKPIGFFLLLWPTLWALWLAGKGHPSLHHIFVFMVGTFLMRSAGCVVNDIADRRFDGHVMRTRFRPLAAGRISVWQAVLLAAFLTFAAFLLVLSCNRLTILFSFAAVGVMLIYPLLKRITHLPQLGLGVAFSFGVPMAFAAETGAVPLKAWYLFLTCLIWPIIYDTFYAMADKKDDIRIGIKSTAILFGDKIITIIVLLQEIWSFMLLLIGVIFGLDPIYFVFVIMVLPFIRYQRLLIRSQDPQKCMRAFLNNQWIGFIIFMGIGFSFMNIFPPQS